MATKQVVLVAGYDYEWKGVSFKQLCLNRMNFLQKKFPKQDINFVIFDTESASLEMNQFVNGKSNWLKLPHTFTTPVTKKNYSVTQDHYIFDKNPQGVMSILDVYEYIQNQGANQSTAGSIIELSILSHGYFGGPILVNSFDATYSDPSKPRDPNDKDGRAIKDFISPTLSPKQLQYFSAAFSPEAVIWLWGCSYSMFYRRVIIQIIDSPLYKKTAPGKLKDTDVFQLAFTQAEAEIYYPLDTVFFPKSINGKYQLELKKTLWDVKRFVRDGLYRNYAQAIAKTLSRPCFGALPGTYADFEKEKVSFPLMAIPTKIPPYADSFKRVIDFYKLYFGVKEDIEARGYGTFPI